MHYIARVIAVFPERTLHAKRLDAWEAIATVQASGARRALDRVVSMSRSVFETSGNLKRLGYSAKPILYVVASISTSHPLQGARTNNRDHGLVVTDMMSLTPRDVEMLKTRHQVSVPLHPVHVVHPR